MEYKIESFPLSKLKLNADNPRFIKDDAFKKLCKSIEECPQLLAARPLIVDEDMVILGGNMRYRAVKELKWKEVSVIVMPGLTEEQKREIVIKDNGSWGEWDFSQLANEWSDLALTDWGIDMPPAWMEEPPESGPSLDEIMGEARDLMPTMKITFASPEQLQKAMIDVQKLLEEKYQTAYFTVSAGGV